MIPVTNQPRTKERDIKWLHEWDGLFLARRSQSQTIVQALGFSSLKMVVSLLASVAMR